MENYSETSNQLNNKIEINHLSMNQKQLWFLDQLGLSKAAYNIPLIYKLQGQLNINILEQSFKEIIRQHSILQTVFRNQQGIPVPSVNSTPWKLQTSNLQSLEKSVKTQNIEATIEKEIRYSFNLSIDFLFRATLLQIEEQESILIIVAHHIIIDGWSLGLIMQDLSIVYTQLIEKRPVALPATGQYTDFVNWETELLTSSKSTKSLQYWKQVLANKPVLIELPTDYPRPVTLSDEGAQLRHFLNKNLMSALKLLSREQGVTLYMTLLMAFQILLARLSSQEQIVVGSPISNRNKKEFQNIVGYFASTAIIATDFAKNPSLEEAFKRIRKAVVGAFANHLPFNILVENLHPDRNLNIHPIFQVLFTLHNYESTPLTLPGVVISPFDVPKTTSRYDLVLEIVEEEEGLYCAFEFNLNLFKPATIKLFAERFERLLESMLQNPLASIWQLPFLAKEEENYLLDTFSRTNPLQLTSQTLVDAFELQAVRSSKLIALTSENQPSLTYEELNNKANQLARYLQSFCKPGMCVGICLERSSELIIGLLAILKAGCTYVPIDPTHPQERLHYIIKDTNIVALITQEYLSTKLPYLEMKQVLLDKEKMLIDQQQITNLSLQISPDFLAYIIYTSGSTGNPKGVQVSHRNISSLLEAAALKFKFTSNDVTTLVHPYSFDFSVWEIWAPLVAGSHLVVVQQWRTANPVALEELLEKEKVTILSQTPSALRQLAQRWKVLGWGRRLPLHTIVCGGEAFPVELARDLLQLLKDKVAIWNFYGPTEATVWVAASELETVEDVIGSVPIGQPFSNSQLYLLDRHMQLLPLGVAGELYIGGEGVAQGYLNCAALTAERFLPDPFAQEPGKRLYRTGDIGRYVASGQIDFIGRADEQVKVRGYRIELQEIENCLEQHPSVQQNVVVLREDIPGDQRLIAYWVANNNYGLKISDSDLRDFLSLKLPLYMIPNAFVQLNALPVTDRGKINRKALPLPEGSRPNLKNPFAATHSNTEKIIATSWSELLRVSQIGVEDNFFELGGHSLLATQVVAKLNQVFDTNLSLVDFFKNPTVVQLATYLEKQLANPITTLKKSSIRIYKDKTLAPASFAQQRLWFLCQLYPDSAYHVPLQINLKGKVEVAKIEEVLQILQQRHSSLRTTFKVVDGQPMQAIQTNFPVRLNVKNLEALPYPIKQAELQNLVSSEAYQPFDLSRGPLFRASLLIKDATEADLLLTLHHIICDGWSINIILDEFLTIYEAISTEHHLELPEPSIQYSDFALWQRDWLQGDTLNTLVKYWKQRLAGVGAGLELPLDFARPIKRTYQSEHKRFIVPIELQEKLLAVGQQEGCTLFMVMLAAFNILLYRYTGQKDICIGSLIANRNLSETENIIGFFVNTLILRTILANNFNFYDVLHHVRELTLEAYVHQDLPFEKVIEEIQPNRTSNHPPLPQVMLVLQNTPHTTFKHSMEDLQVAATISAAPNRSEYDLTLWLAEGSEGLISSLEYSTELFKPDTIERMVAHFQILLESIITSPTKNIGSLNLLTQTELDRYLAQPLQMPTHSTILGMFEKQVEVQPEAVAVVYNNYQLTYRELNQLANQLARWLVKSNISSGMRVGIFTDKSFDWIVSILAVLKLGCVYIPLDSNYPTERLLYILADSNAKILIVPKPLQEDIALHNIPVVCLETDREFISTQDNLNLGIQNSFEDLLYIIYTSGTTGQPKGVAVYHYSFLNLLEWYITTFAINSLDKLLLISSVGFDLTQKNLFAILGTGGKLYLPAAKEYDPNILSTQISNYQITLLNCTPSSFYPLLGHKNRSWLTRLKSLRYLFLGGETIQLNYVQELLDAENSLNIVNTYGPTECTDIAAYYVLNQQNSSGLKTIPIGRPLPNVEVYCLSESLALQPPGAIGELYIGGSGVSLGYLNNPQLTARKFLPNHLSKEPGTRIYKTGDIVRQLPDGNIEFLGRVDQQIKFRGYRIELEEIESVINQYPAVVGSKVILYKDKNNEESLIAYVVYTTEDVMVEENLRQYLTQFLPGYMCPTLLIRLAAFPITAHGKISIMELPEPDLEKNYKTVNFKRASTPAEEALAKIWTNLLGLSAVAINRNFFELGGHSLLAVQMMFQIQEIFDIELPLQILFEFPTIEELAVKIEELILTEIENLSEEEVNALFTETTFDS